jgi:hypothetical protein
MQGVIRQIRRAQSNRELANERVVTRHQNLTKALAGRFTRIAAGVAHLEIL